MLNHAAKMVGPARRAPDHDVARIFMSHATPPDPTIASAPARCNKTVAHSRDAIYIEKQPRGCT
jgi:hypothetical protein